MEHDNTMQRIFMHTENDDISDDEFSSLPWDGNAAGDVSNAPTGPFTHSKHICHKLTAKGFVIMFQGINWLINGWKNVSSWLGRS